MKARYGGSFSALFLILSVAARAQVIGPLDAWTYANVDVPPRSLAYKDGRFVAVGPKTNIVVSSNGVNWSSVAVLTNSEYLLSVVVGAGQFVAVGVGAGGLVLTSPDGLQWTRRPSGLPTYAELWGVTHGGGRFVAAGFAFTNAVVSTSTDGTQWESFLLPDSTLRCIAYGNGVYVAGGIPVSMVSSNARDWMTLNSVDAQGIAFGAGQFITDTYGTNGFKSTNGFDWTPVHLPGADRYQTYYSARYANGMFLAGGMGPQIPLATSTDGIHWSTHQFGVGSYVVIRDIIQVDGIYYLADQGSARIWRSGRVPSASQPRITNLSHRSNESTMTFAAEPGFHYRLECRDRLEAPQWTACGARLFAEGPTVTGTDPQATLPTRFYRVRTD